MTTEQLAKLTPEQKRIRIAELCGWQLIKRERNKKACRQYWAPDKNSICTVWPDDSLGGTLFPDYLNNLNSMHEVEERAIFAEVTRMFILDYDDNLARIAGAIRWHATAAQRADAFLLVMG